MQTFSSQCNVVRLSIQEIVSTRNLLPMYLDIGEPLRIKLLLRIISIFCLVPIEWAVMFTSFSDVCIFKG